MNNLTKRPYYGDNHFNRLSEEIIVSIFDRIANLKCMCHCSLVSKHFASLVYRVQAVSITVTGNTTYDDQYLDKILKMASGLNSCSAEQVHALLDSLSLQHMKFPVFLNKLTDLKCIYLDYDYRRSSAEAKLPMCKIKFCHGGAKFESFVALDYLHMHKDTEYAAMAEDDTVPINTVMKRVFESECQIRVRFTEWIGFLIVLLKCHASLRKVTIADSEVHGKLVLGDEQGDHLKSSVLCKLLKQFRDCIVRIGWVPVLRLPLSGYVMRWAALVIYLPENSGVLAKKLDEIEFWDFNDELPVFREGVKEFVKKHQDKLMSLKRSTPVFADSILFMSARLES